MNVIHDPTGKAIGDSGSFGGCAATAQRPRDPQAEVLAFVKGRSHPCPRCGYNLRDLQTAKCPECGEPLVLKIGSPRARFGWLLLAMAPGCFSGVAACFVLVPIGFTIGRTFPPGQGLPWPVLVVDAFGFLSAAAVVVMYRRRQRIMSWDSRRQAVFAACVWGVHVLMLILFALAMFLARP
jgi:hypothetical protein